MTDPMQLLLQQIVDNTASDDSLWIAAVSGSAAILGALVSALFSYCTTERTIKFQNKIEHKRLKATIITAERLRYLQDLRTLVAELYTQMDMQLSHLQRPVNPTQQTQYQQVLDDFSMEIMSKCHAIFPMLNRGEEDEKELHEALNESLALMQSYFAQKTHAALVIDMALYSALKTQAFNSLEAIGIKIWAKVQSLE
ncbi:MAG: hypothetical protein LWW76_08920 [Burkholderiales bacterium]|nr:hypothetical protein [Burkholderiales bacterium]